MKILTSIIGIVSISFLLTGCDVVSNISNDYDESNSNTIEWRQKECLEWVKDKVESSSYSIEWDEWETEDNGLIISAWLLKVDDWYYDIECNHEKDGEWFDVNVLPIDEVTYWEVEDDYRFNDLEDSESNF